MLRCRGNAKSINDMVWKMFRFYFLVANGRATRYEGSYNVMEAYAWCKETFPGEPAAVYASNYCILDDSATVVVTYLTLPESQM